MDGTTKNRICSSFLTERLLSEHQIDFDVVDEDALASGLKALPGAFETLSGNRYRTLILPAPLVLSSAALARLKTFANSGGKVVIIGGVPQWIADRNFRDARAATEGDFSWAMVVDAGLPATPTPPLAPPASQPEPQAVPRKVLAAVDSAVIAPTLKMDAPDAALRVMKRRWKDNDVYLFFNEGPNACTHSVTLMTPGHTAEGWDAQTGSVTSIQIVRDGAHLVVQLSLQPYETKVIVVH